MLKTFGGDKAMIVEDLLWWDGVASVGLPPGLRGILEGRETLVECEVSDVRVNRVSGTVAVLIDLRPGFCSDADWGAPVNVAALVVRGAQRCDCAWLGGVIGSWDVSRDDSGWSCEVGMGRGPLRIAGVWASLFVGRVVLPDGQPGLWEDRAVIRAGWPTWHSRFELLIEPEHANRAVAERLGSGVTEVVLAARQVDAGLARYESGEWSLERVVGSTDWVVRELARLNEDWADEVARSWRTLGAAYSVLLGQGGGGLPEKMQDRVVRSVARMRTCQRGVIGDR